MFKFADVKSHAASDWHQMNLMKGMSMDIEKMATEHADAALTAMEKLKAVLDKFRSTIGNDLTSMKAGAARVQAETQAMAQAYTATAVLLTSPEFTAAVSNAERLATALEAIHRLQGQRIGFALFSGKEEA